MCNLGTENFLKGVTDMIKILFDSLPEDKKREIIKELEKSS